MKVQSNSSSSSVSSSLNLSNQEQHHSDVSRPSTSKSSSSTTTENTMSAAARSTSAIDMKRTTPPKLESVSHQDETKNSQHFPTSSDLLRLSSSAAAASFDPSKFLIDQQNMLFKHSPGGSVASSLPPNLNQFLHNHNQPQYNHQNHASSYFFPTPPPVNSPQSLLNIIDPASFMKSAYFNNFAAFNSAMSSLEGLKNEKKSYSGKI